MWPFWPATLPSQQQHYYSGAAGIPRQMGRPIRPNLGKVTGSAESPHFRAILRELGVNKRRTGGEQVRT